MTKNRQTTLGILLLAEIMSEVFAFSEPIYNFRSRKELKDIGRIRTTKYGTETISHLAPKIWELLPDQYKQLESINEFKKQIKSWKTTSCPCRLCMTYIHHLGFL